MLARVLRHELRVLHASRALWIALAILAPSVGHGLWSGASFAARRDALALAPVAQREAELERLEALLRRGDPPPPAAETDPADPYDVGAGIQYAALPGAPLAALAIGQSDLYRPFSGVSILSRQRTKLDKLDIESPVSLPLGRADLAFAIVHILPLLLLALSHDMLYRDRERGVLRLLLAQPVSLGALVLGKALARFVALVLPAIALPAAILAATGALAPEGALLGLALWAAIVAAYGAFWIALAVAVGALGRSSATNAVALAAVFFASVAVLPGLASAGLSLAHPPPSRAALINALRDASLDVRRDGSRLLAKYYEDHPELRPAGAPEADFGKLFVSVQLELDRISRPVEARFRERFDEQQALADRLRFLSPALLAQEAMTDLAGTGAARHARFEAQVEELHATYRDFFIPRVLAGRRLSPEDYATIPRFTFREEPARPLAGRVLAALAGLIAPTLALILFAAVRLRRHRVALPR